MRPPPMTGISPGASGTATQQPFAKSFALATALVRTQGVARGIDGDKIRRILEEFGGRVETIGNLQHYLVGVAGNSPVDVGDYLRDMSNAVVSALSGDGRVQLRFETEADCLLPPERAL